MRLTSAVALLVTAALVASCTSKPEDPGETTTSGPARLIDKSLTLNQDKGSALITLVSVIETYEQRNADPRSPGARSGNFVVVDMRFEHKAGDYRLNPFEFAIRQPQNKIVKLGRPGGLYPLPEETKLPLRSQDLPPGKALGGMIAFGADYQPDMALVATDDRGFVIGQWPLAGGEPSLGDGTIKKDINKSLTDTRAAASAVVTVLSVAESEGSIYSGPSASYIVVEVKVEGRTGKYDVIRSFFSVRKADSTKLRSANDAVPWREEIRTDDLSPGQATTGKIAFEGKLEPGAMLQLTNFGGGGDLEWPL